jgi:uncharacterized protein YjiS (DUF1127 family)
MFKRMFRALQKAQTVSALHKLSDRQLADIGIERGQIRDHVESIY